LRTTRAKFIALVAQGFAVAASAPGDAPMGASNRSAIRKSGNRFSEEIMLEQQIR
jgi:hypothetical protein